MPQSDLYIALANKKLYFDNPTLDAFEIQGIVERLNNINRFNGQVVYTVLEHSVNTCLLAKLFAFDKKTQYTALLHELDEAAGFGDITTPVKKFFFNKGAIRKMDIFRKKLYLLYNIEYPLDAKIAICDHQMFMYEVYHHFGREGIFIYGLLDYYDRHFNEDVYQEIMNTKRTTQDFMSLYKELK